VAKSKYAPALFEVIEARKGTQGSSRLAIPRWWKSKQGAKLAGGEEPGPSPTNVPEAPKVPAPPGAEPARDLASPLAESAPPAEERPAPPPLLRVRAGRVELSLNPVSVAVAVGGLLLALLLSYQLGRAFGSSAPPPLEANLGSQGADEVEEALRQRPDPDYLDVGGQPRTPDRSTSAGQTPAGPDPAPSIPLPSIAAGASKRAPGLNYVILETFRPEHKNAAEYAQQLLARHNLQTTLEPRGNAWQLVSAQGFDYRDPAQKTRCQRYLETVISLGSMCSKELTKADLPVYTFAGPLVEKFEK